MPDATKEATTAAADAPPPPPGEAKTWPKDTRPVTKEEQAERDAFVKACIAALRDRDDTQALGLSAEEKKKAPPNRKRAPPDAAGVLRQFCYDFPDASADDCGALAAALRTPAWRGDHRVSARAARGIACLARDKKSGAGAANVALALNVHCVRALLEMDRPAAVRFAAAVALAPPPTPKPTTKRVEAGVAKVAGTFDYSKWDAIGDSDSDGEPATTDPEDIFAAKPVANVAECAAYCAVLVDGADHGTLGAADWADGDVEDVFAAAKLARDGHASSWLLRPRADAPEALGALAAEAYGKYVFLARDLFTSKTRLRKALAAGLGGLALNPPGSHAASSPDGGVALLALASLASDPALRKDADAVTVLRDAARRALPALADLGRALVAGNGGDAEDADALLGSLVALVEASAGVATNALASESGDLETTFDPGQAPTEGLIRSGLLSSLCAVAGRLAPESERRLPATARTAEIERRLHRLLQCLCAQDPDRVGDFVLRAAVVFDVAVSDAFAARCPDEASLWGGRLGLVCYARKASASPRALILGGDALRKALGGLAGAAAPCTVRLARVAALLRHVARTERATKAWLNDVRDEDAAFARAQLLGLQANLTAEAAARLAKGGETGPETADEPPEGAGAAEKLARRAAMLEAARDAAVNDVRRHLKALLAPLRGAMASGKVD